jgi:geranylgeranylglycerol-phosphate geranylgeranyltransferase
MRFVSAILALIRWENALLSALGVMLGAWWATGSVTAPQTLVAAGAAIALTAVANAENDYQDRGIDRIAHPERPLPSGALRPRHARMVVAISTLVAIVLSAALGLGLTMLTVGVLIVMLVYSQMLKRHGVVGNAAVAVLGSLPFVYGGWAAGNAAAALPLLAVAVPLHFAREVSKDLEDVAGDAMSRRTLPITHGAPTTRVVLLGALALFGVGLWPLVVQRPRLGALILPSIVLTGIATTFAWRGRRGGPALYKAAMACAMVSLVIAHWNR